VGTPSAANGSQDLTAILRLASSSVRRGAQGEFHHRYPLDGSAGHGWRRRAILERASGGKSGVDFGLCFQPVPARGSSIRD
jgi:GDP-mannose 6-dehydrogenase